jgi:threonine dehydratase
MARSLAAGHVVQVPVPPTLADGLAGQIDDEALDIGLNGLDEIVTLTEEEIGRTITWLARTHDTIAEGAGAVGVGAVWLRKLTKLGTPAAVVVSGGNIDEGRLREVVERDLSSGASEAPSLSSRTSERSERVSGSN